MDALAPERLQAVLLLSGGKNPAPLMIGLCVRQSAGSLLDAKNAALALCERLARSQRARNAAPAKTAPDRMPTPAVPDQVPPARPAPQPQVVAAKRPSKRDKELPREIFLPAIDPLPYVAAARRAMGEEMPEGGAQAAAPAEDAARKAVCAPQAACGQSSSGKPVTELACAHQTACRPMPAPASAPARETERGAPVSPACEAGEDGIPPQGFRPTPKAPLADRLRPLVWPRGFEALRTYFVKGLPCRLFDLPGWRFVNAAQAGGPDGLWVGMQQVDGRVCRVAYAHRSETPPPGGKPYRPARGTDGHTYQVLWQRV